TVTFELPAFEPKDVPTVEVRKDHLTVSGDSKLSKESDEGGYKVRERSHGK
ncbi:uncharacterized protein EDB91DRAFT_1021481, partial [Suillus paluster]|uniref:uncharacterized protein n=1 Tax=Suillus paluster TaxID=48578 RepID=UPI001B86A044